ncbi:hypothetical protein AVEN_137768-1 [Araneus ventricosus]|uniref:Tesmin/TSO1-like CXC domain-containing protein n=1 Tax=Araneus ventricosus TaxID=182803 RepID=A0A4Y2UXJ4_ARAVE|nr:hypothetical protein AVEN_137768-1 [Araneus ventricosus]
MLTDVHKTKGLGSALTFLTRYSEEDNEFLNKIVTGDETWISPSCKIACESSLWLYYFQRWEQYGAVGWKTTKQGSFLTNFNSITTIKDHTTSLCRISTIKHPVPHPPLMAIFCKCAKECRFICSDKESGIKCSAACANCKRYSCTNAPPENDEQIPELSEDVEDANYKGHSCTNAPPENDEQMLQLSEDVEDANCKGHSCTNSPPENGEQMLQLSEDAKGVMVSHVRGFKFQFIEDIQFVFYDLLTHTYITTT